jgi:hypothetical protein
MTAPKVEGNLSKREEELVAEIQTLKSRLAGFERNELESKRSSSTGAESDDILNCPNFSSDMSWLLEEEPINYQRGC